MERAALELELERIHTECWGWALACCARNRDIAEDTLQSAYLKILSKQARFDGRSSFRTWVFGVIRHTAMEELKRRRTRQAREPDDESAASLAIDPAPRADAVAENPMSARHSLVRSARCPAVSGKYCSSCSITT